MMLKTLTRDHELIPVFGVRRNTKREVLISYNNFLHFHEESEYELIDNRMSLFWSSCYTKEEEISIFPEWFECYFYENLSNDAPREIKLVESYYDFMTREYQDDSLPYPEKYDDGFLACPVCGGIFETQSYFGLIRCPVLRCSSLMNNPYADHLLVTQSYETECLNDMVKYKNCFFYSLTKHYYRTPPNIRGEGDVIV